MGSELEGVSSAVISATAAEAADCQWKHFNTCAEVCC